MKNSFAKFIVARRQKKDIHLSKAGSESSSFSSYTDKAEVFRHRNAIQISGKELWDGKTPEEFAKHLVEIADVCLDDPGFSMMVDPEFMKSWGGVELDKSTSELESDREFLADLFGVPKEGPWKKSLSLEERSELVHKALEAAESNDIDSLCELIKSKGRDGKYLRRIVSPDGKITYAHFDISKKIDFPIGTIRVHGGVKKKKTAQGWVPVAAEKKAAPEKKEEKKEKKAPPGSQLPEKIQAKLKELGVGKLPQSDIPANTIETDFSDTANKAVIRWKDSAGRYQSGYTPQFHEKNAKKKWELISKHRANLGKYQKELLSKLEKATQGSLEHQGTLVAAIISQTGLRPGSSKSLEGRYGVSTLEGEHFSVNGDTVSFKFVGKSGKENVATLKNEVIAKALAGYKKEGAVFDSKVLETARGVSKEQGLKLKDYRTIIATNRAEAAMDAIATPPPLTGDAKKDKRLLAKAILSASKEVAEVLNNTASVSKKNYIHPEVFKNWATKKAGADPKLFTEVMS